MKNLTGRLNNPYYFGSGGVNSEEFNSFFKDFKKSFTYQLKCVGATEIEFSKGHFYLSGFFKVEAQWFYFSLSDVRHGLHQTDWNGNIQLLMRTADGNKDYSGGGNRYVSIKNGMYKDIANIFNLEYTAPKKTSGRNREELANLVIKNGSLRRKFSSSVKANAVAFELISKLQPEEHAVTSWKLGRWLRKCTCDNNKFNYYYDAETKTATYTLVNISDEQLIEGLDLPKGNCYRRNYFTHVGCELTPLATALHDRIKYWEQSGSVNLFHQALMIFRTKFSDEYYTLLD